MKINIYNSNLKRVAIVGDQFISCLWSEGYNTTEPFTLELRDVKEYRKAIKVDHYVGRSDRKALMVIKTVEISNGKIIASGRQAQRVLNDVAFVGTIPENSNIDTAIVSAYNSSRGYQNVYFKETALGVKYDAQISNKSILELCEAMSQHADIGFRSFKDEDGIAVEFYKPQEERVVFSKAFGNLIDVGMTFSSEPLKNYAIVLGEGEWNARKRVDVSLAKDDNIRELIIDARDLQKIEEETDADYEARLRARGLEALLASVETQKIDFTPIANEFGERYDLGTPVVVMLPEYGLRIETRIVRFEQVAQDNRIETTVEVGKLTIKR